MSPSVPHVAELAAVVLAAGAGTRLRPLTWLRPKALCPVGNVPLVDWSIGWARSVTDAVAVNVHHGRAAMESHLAGRVHQSIEEPEALGTAGGVAKLKGWIDGRAVLTLNADSWHDADLDGFVRGWDGERVRVLLASDEFGPRARVVASLLPWGEVDALEVRPTGLYEVVWRPADEQGRLDVAHHGGTFVDCGTPAGYLAANLASSDGRSVVGPGARVDGTVEECVLWPGAVVRANEKLVRAIRADHRMTVLVRNGDG
ncbi:MAG: NTP transferase domain-containing protein [Acidimicrobiia bacterium]|nr:NTP transferase domain-containing protein [Acidimicrobiia bacterium]